MVEGLVSVIVLSYNSEQTIVDTLESIYNQTYSKIEIIIADDCSKDNTKERVEEWIERKKARFVDIKSNFKEKNSGVAINGNEGIRLASGEWIKCIAADDKLLPNCIQDNYSYVTKNHCEIVFSNMHYFVENNRIKREFETKLRKNLLTFCSYDAAKQYKKILRQNPFPAPTAFFSKKLYDKVGGFDEEICMVEDWPFWIRILKEGIPIEYNDVFTVMYRVSNTSISHNSNFWIREKQIKKKYCYPNINKWHILYFYHEKWNDLKWICRNKVASSRICSIIVELVFGIFWPPYLFQYFHAVLSNK